jgi:hypothetical protein
MAAGSNVVASNAAGHDASSAACKASVQLVSVGAMHSSIRPGITARPPPQL